MCLCYVICNQYENSIAIITRFRYVNAWPKHSHLLNILYIVLTNKVIYKYRLKQLTDFFYSALKYLKAQGRVKAADKQHGSQRRKIG